MAIGDWEFRPADEVYYAEREEQCRQGDLFRDVPLGYPWPPDAIDHSAGNRKFLAGPFSSGFGLLLTPTCCMSAQGEPGYAHPVRALAPVIPLEELVAAGAVKAGAVDDLRLYDHLINYLYLPAIEAAEMPESLALLYGAITVHHDYLHERRISQMSPEASVHLKYKLCAMHTGSLFSHGDFEDDGV